MTNLLPYIYSVSRYNIWYSFFAIKLDSVSLFDPSYGEYKNFAFELLNRQIDFINTLDCPEDDRVINLRFICNPNPSFYSKGNVDVVLITRIPDKDKEISINKAKKVFNDIWTTITSISDSYEFEPIMDENNFQLFFEPFKFKNIAEIVRREDVIELKTAKRIQGFSKTDLPEPINKEQAYYVYPFIWGMNSLSKTFKAMLYQQHPTMLSIILRPLVFTEQIESLFLKEIELVDKYIDIPSNRSRAIFQSISKNIHSQLLRLEGSPFHMKTLIASSGSISKGIIDSFGVEITEHAGSPDIVKDVNDDYAFSGGYDWHSFEKKPEKEKAIEDLKWLNINFTAPTNAPENLKCIRYLFDSTQANCAFRFPIPQLREIHGIKPKYTKGVPPPRNIPEEGILLGYNKKEGLTQEVRISRDDRRRHMYVVGQTGTGKSTLLLNMILQDIENKEGVAVLDPHGELIDEVVRRIPENRVKDVIYINFEDTQYPIAINMLECKTELEKDLVVQQLFEIFDRLYDLRASGGPIFETYMKNSLYLLLDDAESGATLLEVQKVFTDKDFRNYKISKAKNPHISEFWQNIAKEAGGEASLANLAPYIISKLSMFIYNNTVRNIISSKESSIDFRSIIDEGKILLVDLCKGKIGAINSNFLGMIITNKIINSALERSDVEDKSILKDFYLYVDEFQNLATDGFVSLLSEARKYRLNAILANQYLTQIPTKVLDAIWGNVGTILSFRLGVRDADLFEKEFYPSFTKNEITKVPNWRACIKLLARGEVLRPFEMKTFPAKGMTNSGIIKVIKEQSRKMYSRNIQDIEKELSERYKNIPIISISDAAKSFLQIGDEFCEGNSYVEACKAYQKAAEKAPNYADAYYKWGLALYYQNKNEGAIEKYKKAIEINPKMANAHYMWGHALFELKKYEEAIEKYKITTEIDPAHPSAIGYYNWGRSFYNLNRYEEAIEKFRQAIKLDPKRTGAYYDWGNALHHLKKYEEAVDKFQKAIELDPNDTEIHKGLELALKELKEAEQAQKIQALN